MASGSGDHQSSRGFDCEFVDPPPDVIQTECPVCLLTIREPHQMTCCGKNFCQVCIVRATASQKHCPACKNSNIICFPDKALRNRLYCFYVRCSHQKDGCEWTGELRQLDAHLNEDPERGKELNGCQFVEIRCLYKCGNQLQRRHMPQHQAECTKRPFSCEHCHDYDSNYDDVVHNHWPVCGSFLITCPNECGSTLPRQNSNNHIAEMCPLTTISCDFYHVGCTVKLLRKDLSEHLREKSTAHTSLLAKQQAEVNQQRAEQQATIEQQGSQITFLTKKIERLEHEVAQLRKQLSTTEVSVNAIILPHPVLAMNTFEQEKSLKSLWLSGPVHTHTQGYKICLGVYANGYGLGNGTHVSVYLFFMKGRYDDTLAWPFHGVISFRLLDQVDHTDHVEYSVTYDYTTDDNVCGRVLEGDRAEHGRGPHKFVAHAELYPKYLQNDTLMFQIHNVQLHCQVQQ